MKQGRIKSINPGGEIELAFRKIDGYIAGHGNGIHLPISGRW